MKKVIFDNNGTLTDFTNALKNYHADSSTVDFTLNEDAIYLGAELPFNSLYFLASTLNVLSSSVTVKYWDGQEWRSMVEVLDGTDVAGASIGQPGHITWVTDKQHNWAAEDTVKSDGTEQITGLGAVTVYDLYWLKVEFSASLTTTTALQWIGPKFSDNADVIAEHTLFGKSAFIAAYETGKTEWEREIVLASRLIVNKLIGMNVILSGEQLLDRSKLNDACVSQVAYLVYKNLGDDYTDDAEKARKEYNARLNFKNYRVDVNANGRLDKNERKVVTGGLYR